MIAIVQIDKHINERKILNARTIEYFRYIRAHAHYTLKIHVTTINLHACECQIAPKKETQQKTNGSDADVQSQIQLDLFLPQKQNRFDYDLF